jgi:hypothetical protein
MLIILMAVGILVLAVLAAQAFFTEELIFGPAREGSMGTASDENAPSLGETGRDFDVNEVYRYRNLTQADEGSVPAIDASGRDFDVNEVYRYRNLTQE